MRRLLVNDALNQLGEHTFWDDLREWFDMDFQGGDYSGLAQAADTTANYAVLPAGKERFDLIIRNATWFPPLDASKQVPTISLLQDIATEGPLRTMQEAVIKSSAMTVFNSEFTRSKYPLQTNTRWEAVIPLPVDFQTFEPQNAMGCQQALGLPDGCVCWIGASQGATGHIKGFDTFLSVARANPDLMFVGVFKDAEPSYMPPNMRCYARLTHAELVKVIGACRVGLCTSRMESQHLAGIEMGACGLPLVVPPVGTYWKRVDWPGCEVTEQTVSAYTQGIRVSIGKVADSEKRMVSDYWRKEFSKPVIRAQWERLVAEVEGTAA